MQIDFHYTATYVVARLAGFDKVESNIIATSAQYVDDATNTGLVSFNTGESYSRISSAHKMIDYRNFQEMSDKRVWIPFHFLPGNNGEESLASNKEFHERLICRPNSPVAKKMVDVCIQRKTTPYSLHRLGVTAHVFIDTWAHQGFLGIVHELNHANKIYDKNGVVDKDAMESVKKFFAYKDLRDLVKICIRKAKHIIDSFKQDFVSANSPVGHGAVLTYPDLPYLKWGYTNGKGQTIQRDNPTDFRNAICELYSVFCRYRGVNIPMSVEDKKQIEHLIENARSEDADERFKEWSKAIQSGKFSFGAETISYIAKGKGSWKYLALGTEATTESSFEKFSYSPNFIQSDWKLFHDAIQAHRFDIIHEVLPAFGICVD